ncbi:MAG: hypothetical protein R3E48_16730 [Burkholderiaceae bacterium]
MAGDYSRWRSGHDIGQAAARPEVMAGSLADAISRMAWCERMLLVDLDDDVVDVVRAGIERGLVVRRSQEAERARHHRGEEGRVRTADDAAVHRLGGQVGWRRWR